MSYYRNKPFDFSADHDPGPGILTKLLPFQHTNAIASSKNFAASAALWRFALSERFCL